MHTIVSNSGPITSIGIAVALASAFFAAHDAQAQGCVAVRGSGLSCALHGEAGGHLQGGDWQVSVGHRWLYSDHHFAGNEDRGPARFAAGTEVINDSHFIDLSALYAINTRFGISLAVPFVTSERSAPYEHAGQLDRSLTTSAGGLADMRITGSYWVWDPAAMPKGNVLLGLGIKLPTGEDNATDMVYDRAGVGYERPVDQSIQPGDGGWGFSVEMLGFREIFPRTQVYGQIFYLFNPEETSSTSSGATVAGARGQTLAALKASAPGTQANRDWLAAQARGWTSPDYFEDFLSIADQYLFRTGFSYLLVPKWGITLTFGGRMEGIPVDDLIGSSNGFRRPGYTISVEPGIAWNYKRWSVAVQAPVAVERVREKSVVDERFSELRGTDVNGDAAFADYIITSSISYRF